MTTLWTQTSLWNSTVFTAAPLATSPTSWDYGIRWASRRTVAPVDLPVSVSYIRDQVLRVTNDDAEDEFIERQIRTAVETYEHESQRALMLQTWQMILSGFPSSGRVELVRPPLASIASVSYLDGSGDAQSLDSSPADYVHVTSGPYAPAEIRKPVNGTFPTAIAGRADAVTITFTAGYALEGDVPESIISGIALLVGELYKNRGLSVIGTSVSAGQLNTSRFWPRFW